MRMVSAEEDMVLTHCFEVRIVGVGVVRGEDYRIERLDH